MTQRHSIQNDVTMFITTNTLKRRPIFSNPAFARKAVDQICRLQERFLFMLFGFVIMPDHQHFLLHVRSPSTISTLMNVYKTGMTFELGIGAFWQPRFDLRVPSDCFAVLEYIHQNPVKAGFVEKAEEYPWSSASGRWEISQMK